MDRKEFLATLGFSAGGIFIASCLGSCKKENGGNPVPPSPSVDFTLDLTQPSNAALASIGGYIYANGVIVAKTATGFIAVAQACTHQGTSVEFQNANNRFYCPNHGALYSTSGTVISGPAPSPLKQYTTTLTGNVLRVNG